MESRTAEGDCKKVTQGRSAFSFFAKGKTIADYDWRLPQGGTGYAKQKFFLSLCPHHVIDLKWAFLLIANFIEITNTLALKFLGF